MKSEGDDPIGQFGFSLGPPRILSQLCFYSHCKTINDGKCSSMATAHKLKFMCMCHGQGVFFYLPLFFLSILYILSLFPFSFPPLFPLTFSILSPPPLSVLLLFLLPCLSSHPSLLPLPLSSFTIPPPHSYDS